MKSAIIVAFWCLLSLGKVAGQEVDYKVSSLRGDTTGTRFWVAFPENLSGETFHLLDAQMAQEKSFRDRLWSPQKHRFYIHTSKPQTPESLKAWIEQKLKKMQNEAEGGGK